MQILLKEDAAAIIERELAVSPSRSSSACEKRFIRFLKKNQGKWVVVNTTRIYQRHFEIIVPNKYSVFIDLSLVAAIKNDLRYEATVCNYCSHTVLNDIANVNGICKLCLKGRYLSINTESPANEVIIR